MQQLQIINYFIVLFRAKLIPVIVKLIEHPISYKQELAIRSNADLIMLTGDGGCGKTRVACGGIIASHIFLYPGIRIGFLTKNYGDYTKKGGIFDELRKIYPLAEYDKKVQNPIGNITTSLQNMYLRFNNGTVVGFYATEDMSREQLTAASKTYQFDILIVEEAQKLSWETINIFSTRVRNSDSTIPNKVYLIQNAERECPLRRMIGNEYDQAGWVNEFGKVIPEKNGTIMYMYQSSGNVYETYWGRTMKECYHKCKNIIDAKIGDNKNISYKNFILKVLFIGFDKADNKAIFENSKYLARLSQSAIGASMGESDWNFSAKDMQEDSEKNVINAGMLTKCFLNKPLERNFKGISFDLAGSGTDNSVALYIEGWHIKDIDYDGYTVGDSRVNFIENFAKKHAIEMTNKNTVIDSTRFDDVATYFAKKYNAMDSKGRYNVNKLPFKQFCSAENPYNNGRYNNFKSQCAYQTMNLIKKGIITFAPELENKEYKHKRNTRKHKDWSVRDEIVFELNALRFYNKNGKICLITKEEQKDVLSNRSMDILDCIFQYVGLFISQCYLEQAGKIDRTFDENAGKSLKEFENAFNINQHRKNAVVNMNAMSLFEQLIGF